MWAQRAERGAERRRLPAGERERERRQQQGRTIAGAVVGSVTAVLIGGSLYVYISRMRQATAAGGGAGGGAGDGASYAEGLRGDSNAQHLGTAPG